jgi:hypothetical protein
MSSQQRPHPPPAPNPSSQPQTPAASGAQASIATTAGPQMVGNQAATNAGPQAFGMSQLISEAGPQSVCMSDDGGGDGGSEQ